MRKVIVTEWLSLDGVAQAPGTPDEDTSGGFRHGGWHLPYFDDISRKWVVDNLTGAGGFLFGRRTYEAFAAYWPHAGGEERVIADPLNSKPKYVASTTLTGRRCRGRVRRCSAATWSARSARCDRTTAAPCSPSAAPGWCTRCSSTTWSTNSA